MRQLLHVLLTWVGQRLVWFVLIVAVLMAGTYLKDQYELFHASQSRLGDLNSGKQQVERHFAGIEKELRARIDALEKASLTSLDARIAAIDREIAEKAAAQSGGITLGVLIGAAAGKDISGPLKRDLEIRLLKQEREHLASLRMVAAALIERDKGQAELERLRLAHVSAYAGLGAGERALAHVQSAHPLARRVPGTAPHRLYAQAQAEYDALYARNQQAYEQFERQRAVMAAFRMPAAAPRFALRDAPLEQTLAPVNEAIKSLGTSPVMALWERALGFVPAAAGILLGLVLVPVAIKAFFYFVLAPIAARLAPVHLLPGASGALEITGASAVSQTVLIDADHELLIDPDYLQSSSVAGSKDTKWLLDWSRPITSLAAGLFALTRIRTTAQESVVVSALTDPLSEVALLSLAQGAALVLQPRCLAGVLQPARQPVRITSHWRLGTLHAWLTLQLRYLVFHGPATLVVKGCRGVRVEAVGPANAAGAAPGRRINQAATIGFSPSLHYATTRMETFFPYLTSKQGLLDDSFTGGPGVYVYEEVPHGGAKAGVTGRGLEGFTDAVLKVFGI